MSNIDLEWRKELNYGGRIFYHICNDSYSYTEDSFFGALYGDLDVSKIDELPPGRKDVKTIWKNDSSRLKVLSFMREQINWKTGLYCFPLIEESEKLDYKNLVEGFNSIERNFHFQIIKVSIVHGKMKPEDKDFEMKRFAEGVTNILVATTVIEVGVNVPNASVMIIESAERFGLSQLHQPKR